MRKGSMKGRTTNIIVLLTALITLTAGVAPVRASENEEKGQQTAASTVAQAPAPQTEAARAAQLEKLQQEQKMKQSYAVGVETGRNYKRQKMELDLDMVAKGMKDAFTGAQLEMSEEEILKALYAFTGNWRSKEQISKRLQGLDNKRDGEVFLAENKAREGVVTLPNGLQYKVLKAGNGRKPTDADTVQINLRGTLVDGTEFFNTAGEPRTTSVSDSLHLVVGLREALKLMPEGSRWQVFIPHNLGFGWRPAGDVIGANSTLIYDVELLSIK